MGTGIFTSGGIVEFASSLYGTDDDPMDTVIMRDGVAHGLLHAADSMAQVRVNWMPPSHTADHEEYETLESSPIAGQWYLMGGSPMGEWPITLRKDGTPYRLRFRMAVSISNASGTASFQLVVAPVAFAQTLRGSLTAGSTVVTTSSTTAAWAAPATYLELSSALVSGWVREVSIADAVSGASPNSTEQVLVAAHVFAKTDNASYLPRLHALHVQEYVGPS